MAEISYPFAADSAGGGTKLVSNLQWQNMANMFCGDYIDFQLKSKTYSGASLPFYATMTSASVATLTPGKASVGGFYYQLTSNKQLTFASNAGNLPRRDSIVLRADLSSGAVNAVISQGQPATDPVPPPVSRTPGGIWEMILYTALVAANNGGITLEDRKQYALPPMTATPWNNQQVTDLQPYGTFSLDMDNNQSGGQRLAYRGHDGYMTVMGLAKRQQYTPDLFTVNNKPASGSRRGFYRYIAPGTISFTVEIDTGAKSCTAASGTSIIGFTLPTATNNATRQVFTGQIDNPKSSNDMPNHIHVPAKTGEGSNNNCYLYYPNYKNLAQGLDALTTIPAYSKLTISGVYETVELY